jgi:hypothetical protein
MAYSLEDARVEVANKTLAQIQGETAMTWSLRAVAAYEFANSAQTPNDKLKWLLIAQELEHEALEHAALVGDHVLPIVRKVLGPWHQTFKDILP